MSRTNNKIQYEAYNKESILNRASNLNITNEGNVVTTALGDNVIKTKEVSDKYCVFDFGGFVTQFMEGIEDYFMPQEQVLRFIKGKQELRLKGETVDIGGEQYHKQLVILNSSDKSRALQLHMGLFRLVCSNGMTVSVDGAYSSIRVKHFNSTLPEKVQVFLNSIENFDTILNGQVSIIESLKDHQISYSTLARALATNVEGEIIPSKLRKVSALGHKLLTSESDKLAADVVAELNASQYNMLRTPELAVHAAENNDIILNASQVYQCYTEIFRNRDAAVQARETNRIMNLIRPDGTPLVEEAVTVEA